MNQSFGRKLLLASLLGSTLSVGLAFAGEPGGRHERMKAQFDANKDGKLDDTERQAMHAAFEAKHEERKQEMLQKYDADKSGTLDDAEKAKMHQERSAEFFKELDTNKDGSLSLAEFQAMKPGGHHGRRGHHQR